MIMQWNGIKVPVVILAFALGLAAFWGIQKIYNQYSYERPLAKLLEENANIITHSINDQGPVLEIEVNLAKSKNLQQDYSGLNKDLLNLFDKKEFKIELQGQREQVFNEIYPDIKMALYEAIDRGNYLDMKRYIAELATKEGFEAAVWIDQDNLYIQVERGDSYFQEIIPRVKTASGLQDLERSGTF